MIKTKEQNSTTETEKLNTRSTRDGAWFLTRRGAVAIRDPRLRAREEDEHRARLARGNAQLRQEELEEGRQRMRANGFVDEALNQIVEGLANNRRMLEDRQGQHEGRGRRDEEVN